MVWCMLRSSGHAALTGWSTLERAPADTGSDGFEYIRKTGRPEQILAPVAAAIGRQ